MDWGGDRGDGELFLVGATGPSLVLPLKPVKATPTNKPVMDAFGELSYIG